MRNGALFANTVSLENAIQCNPNLYNDSIKNAFMAHHTSFHGVQYEKGLYVVIGATNNKLLLGEIAMIFQHNATDFCFLVKKV